MHIRQSVLEKMNWEYATQHDGTQIRFAVHNNELITQKRVTFPENSKTRLMQKAMRGDYSLTNLQVIGTGNSYLIRGWETIEIFAEINIAELAA